MAIARAGIKKILPSNIQLISGPGCPVCVTAEEDIDTAIEICDLKDVTIATFGDMMRVPGYDGSLLDMKRRGHDVRMVYSCLDALDIAKENPNKKIIFLGIGFETTSPTVAATILKAEKEKIRNFFILSYFKLVFPALKVLSSSKRIKIDGFICPGHVSVITGSVPYENIAKRYKKPCVIMGFDTPDLIKGIGRLIKQIHNHEYKVEIEYERAVKREGNMEARKVLDTVFEVADSKWRGIGVIKKSGLRLRKKYKHFDAEREFNIKISERKNPSECVCGEVIQGIKSPEDCKLFRKVCTPRNPVGPCMVSSEGTCAAYYRYGN